MLRRLGLFTVATLLLCACGVSPGPCSTSMLEGFMIVEEGSQNLASASVDLVRLEAELDGVLFEDGEWVISRKNASGCIVAYKYKLNGDPVTAPIFFVEIESRSIFPEDELANTIPLLTGEIAPWGPIHVITATSEPSLAPNGNDVMTPLPQTETPAGALADPEASAKVLAAGQLVEDEGFTYSGTLQRGMDGCDAEQCVHYERLNTGVDLLVDSGDLSGIQFSWVRGGVSPDDLYPLASIKVDVLEDVYGATPEEVLCLSDPDMFDGTCGRINIHSSSPGDTIVSESLDWR